MAKHNKPTLYVRIWHSALNPAGPGYYWNGSTVEHGERNAIKVHGPYSDMFEAAKIARRWAAAGRYTIRVSHTTRG